MRKIIVFFVLFFYLMPINAYSRYFEERNIREINRILREQESRLADIRERLEQCLEYQLKESEKKSKEDNEEDYELLKNTINNLEINNSIIKKIIEELLKGNESKRAE